MYELLILFSGNPSLIAAIEVYFHISTPLLASATISRQDHYRKEGKVPVSNKKIPPPFLRRIVNRIHDQLRQLSSCGQTRSTNPNPQFSSPQSHSSTSPPCPLKIHPSYKKCLPPSHSSSLIHQHPIGQTHRPRPLTLTLRHFHRTTKTRLPISRCNPHL